MFERLHFNKKEKTTDIKTSPVLGEDPKPKTLEESERDERFEKIWEKPKRVILNFFSKDKGKKVESFDVYDMKSENPKTEVPLVVGLGWGELPKSWKKHVKYWTEHGRRVIIPDTPHGISTGKVKEDFPEIEMEKMTALYETLLASGISIKEDGTVTGQVDLVGRSEGAIYSILLAYYYPQLVRNLVLENPAGLAGKTNMGIFAKRWHGQMTQKYEEDGAQPKDFMPNVVVKNPINALRSIKAISETDIRDMLKTIKANGIRVSVILTDKDQFFPDENILSGLTEEHVDKIHVEKGTHTSHFWETDKYSKLIDEDLDKSESGKEKK